MKKFIKKDTINNVNLMLSSGSVSNYALNFSDLELPNFVYDSYEVTCKLDGY